jgi:Tfp pilus assembly protein PilF
LLLSLIPLGLLFALTVTLARTYHAREEGLVQEWFQKGNEDLATGQPGRAFEDFRNSLSYEPNNDLVQLRLAEALLADGRLSESRAYLVNLWDRSPGSGEVNLDLAHISSRMGDPEQAIPYYRAAIYGSWAGDAVGQRRKVRFELCEFLLSRNLLSDAGVEIAALSAELSPGEAIQHEQAGQLFLKDAQPGKALEEFEVALQANPRQNQWFEEAGKAAFDSGSYLKAEAYLAKVDPENLSGPDSELLDRVREVLSDDPFRQGLNEDERAQRTWHDFQAGLDRLQKCSQSSASLLIADQTAAVQDLNRDAQSAKKQIQLRALRTNPELRISAMKLVYQIEDTTSHYCGEATSIDQALILIQQRHAGNDQ